MNRTLNPALARCDLCEWEQDDPAGTKLAAHKQRRHTAATEEVTALMTSDPSHAEDIKAVTETIEMIAASHDGQVDPNHVRRFLPAWILPQCVGAVYNQLVAQGRLERIGWTTNEDRRGRNVGKPLPLYVLKDGA